MNICENLSFIRPSKFFETIFFLLENRNIWALVLFCNNEKHRNLNSAPVTWISLRNYTFKSHLASFSTITSYMWILRWEKWAAVLVSTIRLSLNLSTSKSHLALEKFPLKTKIIRKSLYFPMYLEIYSSLIRESRY